MTIETTRSSYYQKYAMAELLVTLKRVRLSVADQLVTLPGVATVGTRVSFGLALALRVGKWSKYPLPLVVNCQARQRHHHPLPKLQLPARVAAG